MAKNNTGIFVALALALLAGAAYVGRKLDVGKKLQFLPQGVKLTGKFPKQKLDFLLDVVNPSDTDLDVNSIFADVNVNDKPLGRVERTEKIKIAPLKTTTLAVPVKVSLANIPAFIQMLKAIATGAKEFSIQIKGTANAQGVDTPIDNTYALNLPTKNFKP